MTAYHLEMCTLHKDAYYIGVVVSKDAYYYGK